MENWKIVGRFLAVLNHIVEVFKKLEVSLDILEWLVGEGKDYFENQALVQLIAEFRKTERVRIVDEFTIVVNLNAPPCLPFGGAVVHNKPKGKGWVEVKRAGDDLLVDGKKVVLFLSGKQKGDKAVVGTELKKELETRPVLHPNIMDALVEKSPHLIPESWKQNEEGETLYIYFWDVVFRGADGRLCVRCFYWSDGAWCRSYHWLAHGWIRRRPAAELAS